MCVSKPSAKTAFLQHSTKKNPYNRHVHLLLLLSIRYRRYYVCIYSYTALTLLEGVCLLTRKIRQYRFQIFKFGFLNHFGCWLSIWDIHSSRNVCIVPIQNKRHQLQVHTYLHSWIRYLCIIKMVIEYLSATTCTTL